MTVKRITNLIWELKGKWFFSFILNTSASYYGDIVERNAVLVTYGRLRVHFPSSPAIILSWCKTSKGEKTTKRSRVANYWKDHSLGKILVSKFLHYLYSLFGRIKQHLRFQLKILFSSLLRTVEETFTQPSMVSSSPLQKVRSLGSMMKFPEIFPASH